METMPDWGWLLLAQAVGTWLGWNWGYKKGAIQAAEAAIDALTEQGYLKQRKSRSGEIELLKPKSFHEENV